MAEILFSHCNHLYFDRKQTRKMQPYPPLQTLMAASVLRREGFDIAFFDSTLNPPGRGFQEALAEHCPRLVVLCEDNFNFLTKMCLTRNRELAFEMTRAALQEGCTVVVNSSDATDHTSAYLQQGVDYVIVGEMEATLLELARKLLRREAVPMEAIDGLTYFDSGGRVHQNRRREVLADLDWLPFPAWDLVDTAQYRDAWRAAHGYFSLNMVTSRGCPYRCNWCAKPIYGNSYHHRSADLLAEEMGYLKNVLGAEHIWFADDIFALSHKWTLEFAEAVERLDAVLPFKMQSRCDLMTRDTVEALRRAGCREVWMGAESGSQKILDAMEKGIQLTDIRRARENLARHGIRACYFLQFGYPGETWEDIQATINLVRETRPDDIGVSVAYPLPGTRFHEMVAAQLAGKTNWEDSDDLAMMFRGTYATGFYRVLRDALDLEVEVFNGRADCAASSLSRLAELWLQVEHLEKAGANPLPTVLWTCS